MTRGRRALSLRNEADRNEAARLIKFAAENLAPHETTKTRIKLMAHTLEWTEARTRSVWFREARVILAHEMDRLRAVARDS